MSTIDQKIKDAQRRAHQAQMRGASGPHDQEWADLQSKAAAIVAEKFPSFGESPPVLSPREKRRPIMVPPDYVPVRAETILGLECRLAQLEAEALSARRDCQASREDLMLMRAGYHPLEEAVINAIEALWSDGKLTQIERHAIKSKIEDFYGRSLARMPRMT